MEFIVITELASGQPRMLSIRHIINIFGTNTVPIRAAFVMEGSVAPVVATHTAQEILTRALAAGVAVDLRS